MVRKKSPKLVKRLAKELGGDISEELDAALVEVDVTAGAAPLLQLFKSKQIDALLIATSATPKINPLSLLKSIVLKLVGRKAPPSFYFRKGGSPEEVDWLGQRNQIDAAVGANVDHIVICSSMGGTQPDNFLNVIGTQADGTGGSILLWKRKAEAYAMACGLNYTILHPGGLLHAPGGRRVVFGVDDSLLDRTGHSIPRDDVAEVMVQSLFVPQMRNRSLDLCSDDAPRMPGGLLSTLLASPALGNCDYGLSGGEPKSKF